MKAAVYYENGPPSVLKYEDVPDPECMAQGIVIKVEAVSIEGGDTLNRGRGELATVPHIVGYQAAGTIIEVGSEVTHLKAGQRVTTVNVHGSHAELRSVFARTAWVVPDNMDIKTAAAIPVPFGTAHDCLFEFGKLQKGETVLVQAGAGAVGLAAIQLAKQAGATVIATASSDERLEKLREYGMDQKSILALAYRGRVSMVGMAGREDMKIDVSSLMGGNQSLSGVFLGAEIFNDRVHDNIQKLIGDIAKGELKVVLDKSFALKDAAAAHEYIESRKAFGRVTLIP